MLLILEILVFISMPIENGYSRMQEHNADVYGLEVIHGIVPNSAEVAAHSFQILGEIGLADPNPPALITFWLYSHPPLAQRLVFAHTYDPWSKGESPKYVKTPPPAPTRRASDASERWRSGARCRRSSQADARRRAKLATLLRLPQIAIEHQRRLCVRDLSQKKSPQPGLAQTRTLARFALEHDFGGGAGDGGEQPVEPGLRGRRIGASSVHRFAVSSSWPSVMRRTSLIGLVHSDAMGSFLPGR